MRKWFREALIKAVRAALKDPEVQRSLWRHVERPRVNNLDDLPPKDPWLAAWDAASADTGDYVLRKLLTVPLYDHRRQLFDAALERVTLDGSYLEFGCGHAARSINYLAERIDGTIHGFDSFEGLPEAWFGELGRGSLTTNGELPEVRDNVQLHPGWFDVSVPTFAAAHPEPVAFMHVDCDLYSSTRTILDGLQDQIVSGTVIQFDEYFNYPGWREHEFKAFQEFVAARGLRYEYLGYSRGFSVAVQIN